jgi:hypothetical protein
LYVLTAYCTSLDWPVPVLAQSGGDGRRCRYLLGGGFDEPTPLNAQQLQTAVARAFESPGVTELRLTRIED